MSERKRWTLHWAETPSALVCHDGYCPHCFDVKVHGSKPDSVDVMPVAEHEAALGAAKKETETLRGVLEEAGVEVEAVAGGVRWWNKKLAAQQRVIDEVLAMLRRILAGKKYFEYTAIEIFDIIRAFLASHAQAQETKP